MCWFVLLFTETPSLRTVTNYFVLSLAITDLSAALFLMPLKAASTVAKKWIAGEMGCKVDYFFANVTGGVSLLTVMLVAINRYIRIVKQNRYLTIYTEKRSIVMAVSAWIVTLAVVVMKSVIAGLRFQTFTILPTFCIHIVTNPDVSIAITVVDNIYIIAHPYSHRSVLSEDFPNRPPSQYGGHSTSHQHWLWSRGGKDDTNTDCGCSWVLFVLAASTRH